MELEELEIRQIAENLWQLLDDIDTASDIFKPSDNNPNSYKAFYRFAMQKQADRFKYLASDGYKLFTKSEWKNYERKLKLKQIENPVEIGFKTKNN